MLVLNSWPLRHTAVMSHAQLNIKRALVLYTKGQQENVLLLRLKKKKDNEHFLMNVNCAISSIYQRL